MTLHIIYVVLVPIVISNSVQVPSVSINEAICRLPPVRRLCTRYRLHWYYNTADGDCSRFWYGGCDRNKNIFESLKLCRERCLTNKTDTMEDNSCLERQIENRREDISTDCLDIKKMGKTYGVYSIYPDGQLPIQVYCDIDGGGWTAIQRRVDNSVNFTRGWDEYVNGFGDLAGNFWLGLKYIHLLTSSPVDILFEVVTKDTNETALMQYTDFYIDGEDNKYTVHFNISGTYNTVAQRHLYALDNGFGFHNGKPFATFDRPDPNFCVEDEEGKGGWWYGWCWRYNLNNAFEDMDVLSNTPTGSVTRSEMKIRRHI